MKRLNIILIVVAILLTFCVGSLFVMRYQYNNNIDLNINETYTLTVKEGSSANEIITNLADDEVVNSEFYTKLFYRANQDAYPTIIPGTYVFTSEDDLHSIFKKISTGNKVEPEIFQILEGYSITKYAKDLAIAFGDKKLSDEILTYWNDKTFLQNLIDDYDMLDESILQEGIYYPLEGYLAPNTYFFEKERFSMDYLDEITRTLVTQRQLEIDEVLARYPYNDEITNAHELITLASIVEREATGFKDRQMVAGVFMNRLTSGDHLGSDITTYYGVKLEIHERDLTEGELKDENPYNTRGSVIGLPIGPVNNPSMSSIEAVLNYTPSDYYYFVSDKNGKMYYSETEAEHEATVEQLKEDGLWYTWE